MPAKMVLPAALRLFLFFPLTALPQETATGTLRVLVPAAAEAFLLDGGQLLPLETGKEVRLRPGTYRLLIRHPDYAPYERSIDIQPGAQRVLLPGMELTRQYVAGQTRAGLDRRQQEVCRALRTRSTVALVSGALGAASLAGMRR